MTPLAPRDEVQSRAHFWVVISRAEMSLLGLARVERVCGQMALEVEESVVEMLDVVHALYSCDWNEAPQVVPGWELQPAEAAQWVEQLTQERGWRERVAAAKLVSIFDLQDWVEPLVATFERVPENYTCRAFHRMLTHFPDPLAETQRQRMRAWCLHSRASESYQQHLLSILEAPAR